MTMTMNIHGAGGVRLLCHLQRDTTEWASIQIGDLKITVFDRESIDDVMQLPRADDFESDFPEDMTDDENEAAWMEMQERLMESGGPEDSTYRKQMIGAGRGHLLR